MLRLFSIHQNITQRIEHDAENLASAINNAQWTDVHEAKDVDCTLLTRLLYTELPESNEIEEIEASARCFFDKSGIHIHSLFMAPSEGRHQTVSVAYILQKERLITIAARLACDIIDTKSR